MYKYEKERFLRALEKELESNIKLAEQYETGHVALLHTCRALSVLNIHVMKGSNEKESIERWLKHAAKASENSTPQVQNRVACANRFYAFLEVKTIPLSFYVDGIEVPDGAMVEQISRDKVILTPTCANLEIRVGQEGVAVGTYSQFFNTSSDYPLTLAGFELPPCGLTSLVLFEGRWHSFR